MSRVKADYLIKDAWTNGQQVVEKLDPHLTLYTTEILEENMRNICIISEEGKGLS